MTGGFPEVQGLDAELRRQVLRNYVDVVILRDVVERYSISNVVALRALIRHIMSAPATRFSVNKFYQALRSQGVACTKNDLYAFLEYLTDAFLVSTAPTHARSEHVRRVNPKKVYAIDTGLLGAMAFHALEDRGALLENLVYMHLRRQGLVPEYYITQAGSEVDFVVLPEDERTPSDPGLLGSGSAAHPATRSGGAVVCHGRVAGTTRQYCHLVRGGYLRRSADHCAGLAVAAGSVATRVPALMRQRCICPQPCHACGQANPPQAKFCNECGTSLGGDVTGASPSRPASPPAPGLASRAATPQVYTPPHLAEKILTAKSALEGERKQVTVLFADLKDSMELLAGLDPEEAQQLLDPALQHHDGAVHRFEGTVNQVLGDGIMALFGAPIAHEDHALRACYAALAMQAAMRAYTDEVRRTRGLELRMRVGLNSGEVVVRAIGNDLHMDYSAVGETTVLAARMEQTATPGSIRLSAATLRLVEGLVQVTALGPVPVKGLAEPVEVFELVGASHLRRRLQAAAVRGLTPFVGRQHELEALHQALAQAQAGHGQVVALVGDAGVGKSRLVYEVIHSHRTQGWRVLESASVSYGKATPYFPVIDLLKRYCHIDDGDEARTIRARVTGQVLTLDETLQDTLPALLALLDVLPDDSPFGHLDPSQRRQRTLEALRRVLLRESQVQPLLLVFEDLHWIDSETQALLDRLIESLPTAHLLLLVNYRPEYQHGWGSKTYYTQLRLDPLPPASAEAFLAGLLGDDPSLAPLLPLFMARTAGNPFFLEESVRTLVETAALVGTPGAYRLAAPLQGMPVPATVQAVLAARIDRLAPEEKGLLQTAAVLGTDVPFTLLRAIADVPEAALHRSLAHLQAAEFLYETRLFPEPEYTFKHALTHEVAYGSLLLERRRGLHARLVEAIEALAPERGTEGLLGRSAGPGRTPGAPCPAGRGVGQSRDLLPAGRRQGLRPRRVPRGGGLLRAGPPGPRAPARARRHQGAGH